MRYVAIQSKREKSRSKPSTIHIVKKRKQISVYQVDNPDRHDKGYQKALTEKWKEKKSMIWGKKSTKRQEILLKPSITCFSSFVSA